MCSIPYHFESDLLMFILPCSLLGLFGFVICEIKVTGRSRVVATLYTVYIYTLSKYIIILYLVSHVSSTEDHFWTLSVFFIPGLLDFVLLKSIFTHNSLLCIVLRVSCRQSSSCSVGVLVLCMIGLSAMSLPRGDCYVMG